jgi:hypothetical protein
MKLFGILPWFLLLTIILLCVAMMPSKEGLTTEDSIVGETPADMLAVMVSPSLLLVSASRSINGTSYNKYKDLSKQKFPNMNLKVYNSMNDEKTNEFLAIISTKNLTSEGNVVLKPNPLYNITLPNSATNKPFIDVKPELNV